MKMLKKTGAVVLAAGLALSVSGCSEKTVDTVKTIQESGVLKVAIVNSDNEYTGLEGDKPVGMEPELIETIASALGVSAEYQVLSQSAALEAVTAGTADVAVGCIDGGASLAENYRYTTPYGKGFYYVVTEKGDYAQSADAFANSIVGVDTGVGSDTRNQMSGTEGVIINEYANAEMAAADIKDGRIRAYICGIEDAQAMLSDSELQVQNLCNVDPAEYVIVAGKEDQSLVSGMNTLIAQFLEKE